MNFIRQSKNRIYIFLPVVSSFIATIAAAQDSSGVNPADSALLKQVEEQMNASNAGQTSAAVQPRSSLSFNPDIGVIGDFQGSYISKGDKNFDMYLNETEISLQATVGSICTRRFFPFIRT
jgi:hypothetical protein